MKLDRVIAVRNKKTVFRDGNKCIKVFNKDYSKAEVLSEALGQARAEETGLNVPAVLEVTVIDGKWAIVSEFIRGKTLAQLMEEEPDRRGSYIEQLVGIQLEILSRRSPLLPRLKDKMNQKICAADLDATTRYELHSRLEEMPRHSKVCHGDISPANIIITPDGEHYVIDWAHVTQGNASADAARTYLNFWLAGDITGAEKYLDAFCSQSGTERRYVRSWMPIVAASQSVKGNEKEREFLLSWVNAVDYE